MKKDGGKITNLRKLPRQHLQVVGRGPKPLPRLAVLMSQVGHQNDFPFQCPTWDMRMKETEGSLARQMTLKQQGMLEQEVS